MLADHYFTCSPFYSLWNPYNSKAIRTVANVKNLSHDAWREGREYTTRHGKKIEARETPSPNVSIQNNENQEKTIINNQSPLGHIKIGAYQLFNFHASHYLGFGPPEIKKWNRLLKVIFVIIVWTFFIVFCGIFQIFSKIFC